MPGIGLAITATSARTALGRDLETTLAALGAGDGALGPVAGFDASGFGSPRVAQIWREQPGREDDPVLRILGQHGRLLDGLATAVHAAADLPGQARERIGLFVALGMVDTPGEDLVPAVLASRTPAGAVDLHAFFGGAFRAIHPLWPLSTLGNVAVGQVATDLDLRGDNLVLASDAVAGVRALVEAARAVADGQVDAALVAGVAEPLGPAALARLALAGHLDAGLEPGEGGAALVLARGVGTACGRLRGAATTFGPADQGLGPGLDALERAAAAALDEAGVAGEAIDLVGLPGTPVHGGAAGIASVLGRLGCAAAARLASALALGHLGPGAPCVDVALALRLLATKGRPLQAGAPGIVSGGRAPSRPGLALLLAAGAEGGAGALVVEGPA